MFEKTHSCKICLKSTTETEFYIRTNKCGNKYLSSYCKPCERERSRNLKKKKWNDPELGASLRESAKARTSSLEYKEARAQEQRQKYATNLAHREKIKASVKEYNNTEEGILNKKLRAAFYYQENKEVIREKLRRAQESNPKLKIRGFMRSRINETLKQYGSAKGGESSFLHLPYTKLDLYAHLESRFEPWMNFKNYGSGIDINTKWQIDHIIPQSYFPYSSMDSELFRWCWDLKNLRPLCSVRNASEGNREELLGPSKDIRLIIEELQNITSFSNLRESIEDVVNYLRSVPPVENICPMGMQGLNYLDSIFVHRLNASTSNFISLTDALKDSGKVLDSIRYLITKNMVVNKANLYSVMKFANRTPGHFFPAAAASVLKKYSNEHSHVHDPFLGWGGRALAALSVGVRKFTGTDLQPETVEGCRLLYTQMGVLSNVQSEFYLQDALSYLTNTDSKFDLIFTSPPYYETENYNVKTITQDNSWLDNFIIPLCKSFFAKLNEGGKVALHLKDISNAPTFTAYHSSMIGAGFRQIAKHKYGRTWTQSIYVYGKLTG